MRVKSSFRSDAERAIATVAEASCLVCSLHDGRACYSCGGDRYTVANSQLDVRPCEDYANDCVHWKTLRFNPRRLARDQLGGLFDGRLVGGGLRREVARERLDDAIDLVDECLALVHRGNMRLPFVLPARDAKNQDLGV